MKKTLLLLSLTLIPLPASAITWNQFWKPFRYERPYSYYAPTCTERVYRHEYVPATYWRPAYTRTWTEVVAVPCYDY